MQRIPLRQRIFLLLLIIPIIIVGISLLQLQRLNGALSLIRDIIDNDIERLVILQASSDTVSEALLVYGDTSVDTATARARVETARGQLAAYKTEFAKHVQSADMENISEEQSQNKELIAERAFTLGNKALTEALLQPRSNLQVPSFIVTVRGFEASIGAAVRQEKAVIEKEHEEAEEVVGALITWLVATNASLLVAIIIVGFLISSMLRWSVEPLLKSTERLALGDFSQNVPVKTNDEIGRLAASYNTMSERLRESYARLALEKQRDEAILQRMSEGLVALDAEGRVVLCNPIARTILDIDKPLEQLITRPFHKLVHFYTEKNKPLPYMKTPIAHSLKKAQYEEGILLLRRQTAQALIHISVNPIIVDKVMSGAVVLLRDITKEHEIDRMKTEFISLASHQLRTPLSAIKWFSDMLVAGDAGKLKAEQQEFAQNIASSAERMIELVNSLLNISRIESGRIMIDPVPTDLKGLIDGIVNDLSAKTAERQQTLVVSVHPELPKISVDPKLIGQVYLNLLSNAIKYTPKGGEISVIVSRKGEDVISRVSDNGYGIPKEEQGRMFEKFFRATNVTRVETDGTGLGLYLIKAIVESSGGKIWFESEENKGTTFWFTIPLSGMKPKEGEVTLDVGH